MTNLLAAAVAGKGLVDPAEPVFHPDDEALLRGAAAFETVRIRGGRTVLLRLHVERLERSCLALRLQPPDGVVELAEQAVEAAGTDQGALRLFRTGMTLLATVAPLPAGLESLRERGLAVVTVRSHDAGLLTGVKATSYATALAAIAEAEKRGADDAIYLGEGETVLEGTMSNIWWREDDVLVTPSLATGVLPGRHPRRGRCAGPPGRLPDPRGLVHAAEAPQRRGGVHELGGARDHAGGRRRRPRDPARRGCGEDPIPPRARDRRVP